MDIRMDKVNIGIGNWQIKEPELLTPGDPLGRGARLFYDGAHVCTLMPEGNVSFPQLWKEKKDE